MSGGESFQVRGFFKTDRGQKRASNQDNGGAIDELGLYFVADGMGGHRGGEVASQMVAEKLPIELKHHLSAFPGDPKKALEYSLVSVNHSIYQRAKDHPELMGMGTTTTALLFRGKKLYIGHVGDSRAYFCCRYGFWQLTRDHSLVEEKMRAGLITREQVKTDRSKNIITRSIGYEPQLSLELFEMDIELNDSFLICSDGLSGMIDHEWLAKFAQKARSESSASAELVTKGLIDQANLNGGEDNISAVWIDVIGTHSNA